MLIKFKSEQRDWARPKHSWNFGLKKVRRQYGRSNLVEGGSVTRLGDFWKFLATNLLTKVLFWKRSIYVKLLWILLETFGQLLETFGQLLETFGQLLETFGQLYSSTFWHPGMWLLTNQIGLKLYLTYRKETGCGTVGKKAFFRHHRDLQFESHASTYTFL